MNTLPVDKTFQIDGKHVFYTGFALCIIFTLLPIYSASLLPMVDYPIHLALIQMVHAKHPLPESLISRFTFQWFTPYSTTYLSAYFLSFLFSTEIIGKIFLAFYFAGTPVAFLFLLKSLGLDKRYVFLVFPALFNFNVSWGFLPFLLAIPMVLFSISPAVAVRANPRGSNPKTYYLSGLLLLLFFTHLFAFIITVIFTSAVILFHKKAFLRRFILSLLLPAPAGLLGIAWYSTLRYSQADQSFLAKRFQVPSPGFKLKYLADFVLSGDHEYGYRVIFFLMCLIFAGHLVSGFLKHGFRFPPAPQAETVSIRILLFFLSLGLYLACPYSLLTAVWLFNRLAFIVFLFAVLLLPAKRSGPYHAALDILAVGVIIVMSVYTTNIYLHFEREAAGCITCIDAAAPEASLQMFLFDNRSRYTDHTVYEHFDQYYQLRRHGRVHNPFALLTHIPIRYRPEFLEKEYAQDVNVTGQGGEYFADIRFEMYEYFLVRIPETSIRDPIPDIFGDHFQDIRFVHQDGRWILFRKKTR